MCVCVCVCVSVTERARERNGNTNSALPAARLPGGCQLARAGLPFSATAGLGTVGAGRCGGRNPELRDLSGE